MPIVNIEIVGGEEPTASTVQRLADEMGEVFRKINLVSVFMEHRFLHRSFCAVLVRARKSAFFARKNTLARVTCIVRARI